MLKYKSQANLELAKECCSKTDKHVYSAGVSRAYYSVYQIMKIIMRKNTTHYYSYLSSTGLAKTNLYGHKNIHFALIDLLKNSSIDKKISLENYDDATISKYFEDLYAWRIQGDYEDHEIDLKTLEKSIEKAEKIITLINKYLDL